MCPPFLEVVLVPLSEIHPSPENDLLYGGSDISLLAQSIAKEGIQEPLTLTQDYFILSGHRRFEAAKSLDLYHVPARFEVVTRSGVDSDRYLQLLALHNDSQRVKTTEEQFRESLALTSKEETLRRVISFRKERSQIHAPVERIEGEIKRKRISSAKAPLLNAILRIIQEQKEYWPLTDRRIHYALLNDPPLRHARKPDSHYKNDRKCYHDVCNLLTRARLEGSIPFECLTDETRPVELWSCHSSPGSFLKKENDLYLRGYWRNLLQSQPNHIEVIGEKNTIEGTIKPVCSEFTLPYTIGRGFSSLDPRHKMAERFKRSKKEKLILLVLSDLDPEGVEIGHSFPRSLRDDFGITEVTPVRVAITPAQVHEYQLKGSLDAKKSSSNYKKFLQKYGSSAYELEALPPDLLQSILRETILSVLDVDAFKEEERREQEDLHKLEAARSMILTSAMNVSI